MHLPGLRLPVLHLLAQPILQAALAAATIGATALLLARRADAKPARIRVEPPRPRHPRGR